MYQFLYNSFDFSFQNSDIYWSPTLAVQSDPASFIVKLAESLKGYKGSSDWINFLREKDNSKEEVNQYIFFLNFKIFWDYFK